MARIGFGADNTKLSERDVRVRSIERRESFKSAVNSYSKSQGYSTGLSTAWHLFFLFILLMLLVKVFKYHLGITEELQLPTFQSVLEWLGNVTNTVEIPYIPDVSLSTGFFLIDWFTYFLELTIDIINGLIFVCNGIISIGKFLVGIVAYIMY